MLVKSACAHTRTLRFFPLLLGVCALTVCALIVRAQTVPTVVPTQYTLPRILFASTNKATLGPTADSTMIPGLKLILPAARHANECALVTLSASAPYATGENYPGIIFSIVRQDTGQAVAQGASSYSEEFPESSGRLPCTVQAVIPLQAHTIPVAAFWLGVRGSSCFIDDEGAATLSAVIGQA